MNKARSNLAKGTDEIFWRIEVEILTGKLEEFHATCGSDRLKQTRTWHIGLRLVFL